MVTARSRRFAAIALPLAAAVGAALAQAPGECPQPRFTGKAPEEYWNRANPLPATGANLAAGEAIYAGEPRKVSCATCHGRTGDGKGEMAGQFDPPPRNFRCAQTVNGIPDGQLFWIVRHGSPGTSMPPHRRLTDEQVWQVVLHLRRLAR